MTITAAAWERMIGRVKRRHQKALLLFLWHTGARMAETAGPRGVRRRDLDTDKGIVVLRSAAREVLRLRTDRLRTYEVLTSAGAGQYIVRQQRTVPVDAGTLREIVSLAGDPYKDDPVFPLPPRRARRWVAAALALGDIEGTPLDIRDAFGYRMAQAGVPSRELLVLMGCSNLSAQVLPYYRGAK